MTEAFTLQMLAIDAFQYSIDKIWQEILTAAPEQIIDPANAKRFAARLYDNWMLFPLEWDQSRQRQLNPDTAIDLSGRRVTRSGPAIWQLALPLISKKSNPRVLTLRPERGWVQRGPDLGPIAAYVEKDAAVILRGTADDLSNFTGTAETLVQLINADVEKYYSELASRIDGMISSRQKSILQDQEEMRLTAARLGAQIPTAAPAVSSLSYAHHHGSGSNNDERRAKPAQDRALVRPPEATFTSEATGLPDRIRTIPRHNTTASEDMSEKPPVKAFIAYAREDERLLQQLVSHLSVLQRTGMIADWYDRKIIAGSNWESEIDKHLDDAELILLLVSPAFIASNYCFEREMQRALERHEQGLSRVVPVIVRPVHDWKATPLGRLQAVPKDGKPISTWPRKDDAWVDVVAALRLVISDYRQSYQ